MKNKSLISAKAVHFIGIGGIGISAIARMILRQVEDECREVTVSGSDREESKVTEGLRKGGVLVYIGQKKENIPKQCDLVIYTVAISETNEELAEAKRRNIPVLSYPQVLNIISREKYTIAISGTHGKTTTTAMVAKILIDGGLDPTVIIGSILKDKNTNFIFGRSDYLVVEADEYRKSFHSLEPTILVITNIDEDHLDFYKDLVDIQNAFAELVKKIPEHGFLICDMSNPHVLPATEAARCTILDCGTVGDFTFKLKSPGTHNRQNAKAALLVGGILGISKDVAEESLKNFGGTWRRFEYRGKTESGATVYDDYAHNPQKVRAAIAGAREMFPDKKITVVFQPHLYSRTKLLLGEFAQALQGADFILIAPIYAARETADPEISSEMLVEKITRLNASVIFMNSFEEIAAKLKTGTGPEDLIITMGAGDVHKICDSIVTD